MEYFSQCPNVLTRARVGDPDLRATSTNWATVLPYKRETRCQDRKQIPEWKKGGRKNKHRTSHSRSVYGSCVVRRMKFIFITLVINKIKSNAINKTSPRNRKAERYNFDDYRQNLFYYISASCCSAAILAKKQTTWWWRQAETCTVKIRSNVHIKIKLHLRRWLYMHILTKLILMIESPKKNVPYGYTSHEHYVTMYVWRFSRWWSLTSSSSSLHNHQNIWSHIPHPERWGQHIPRNISIHPQNYTVSQLRSSHVGGRIIL
jgi:hypothetical protein